MVKRLGSRGLLFGLVVVVGVLGLPGASSALPPNPSGGCQAVGLRVGSTPFGIANVAVTPCANDYARQVHVRVDRGSGSPWEIDLYDYHVRTASQFALVDWPQPIPGLFAEAEVADATVAPLSMPFFNPIFGVRAVWATANVPTATGATCTVINANSAESSVGKLYLGTTSIPVGNEPMDVPIDGVGVLHLNWKLFTGTLLVQRAVYLETGDPASDVVISEVRVTGCPFTA